MHVYLRARGSRIFLGSGRPKEKFHDHSRNRWPWPCRPPSPRPTRRAQRPSPRSHLRSREDAFPAGVEVAQGDPLDIDAVCATLAGVRTLFLLNAVTGDESTQALITLNLAREAEVDRIFYLSVFDADRTVNVPHFAVKLDAERMLETMDFGATILRPTTSSSTTKRW